jgi:hypothetical protein
MGFRPLPVFDAAHEQRVPERVHLGPPLVHHLREVFVYLCGTERVSVLPIRFFGDDEAVEKLLEVLKVGHVAGRADDGVIANGV